MKPTEEELSVAAYHRWEQRGFDHGRHDEDWLSVEQDLLFAFNYWVSGWMVEGEGDGVGSFAGVIGDSVRPVCRFCEQAAPRTRFELPRAALPKWLCVPSPIAADQCEECWGQFEANLAEPLERLASAVRSGTLGGSIPMAAYKALVRCGLALLPRESLEVFPDALEWVGNPEPDPDDVTIARSGLLVHRFDAGGQRPWSAIALKTDSDAAMPSVIAFFGNERATIELPLPWCLRDDDLDGEPMVVPKVATIDGLTRISGSSGSEWLAVTSDAPRRRSRMMSLSFP